MLADRTAGSASAGAEHCGWVGFVGVVGVGVGEWWVLCGGG